MKIVYRIVLAGIILFFIWSLARNFFEYQKNIAFYRSFREDYTATKQENTRLKTSILIASDSSQLEKTIRDRLNLSKEGEFVVILPTPTPNLTTPTPTPEPAYMQWLHVYFKN